MNTKQLKAKVLDLAIHGKLLSPETVAELKKSPDYETADVLLEKIRKEKEEKIAKGELKRDKKDSYIFVGADKRHYEKFTDGTVKDIEDEIPFDVPEGWAWSRLGEIVEVLDSQRKPITKSERKSGIYPYYGATCIQDYVSDYLFDEDLLLLGEDGAKWGAGDLSAFCISGKTWVNNHAHVLRPKNGINIQYLCNTLIILDLSDFITGTTVPKLNQEKMSQIMIPLPSTLEQNKINLLIKTIIASIDKIEKNRTELQTSIKQTKSKILDLAIHGKLVPQDVNDEPASVLLEKLRAEKEDKIAKGELKRDKNDSYIYKGSDNCYYEKFNGKDPVCIDEEIPFDIPKEWTWCRLSELAELKGGKRIPAGMSATKDKTDHIYIRVSDMKNDTITTDDLHYISDTIFEQIKQYIIGKDDLYLTIAGTIGRVGEVPELFDKMNLTENALKITNININKKYLLIVLKSPYVQDYFASTYHQVAMPKLSLTNASKTIIPLPPISEQKRIVSKIEEMFEQLDQIQNNLI